MVRKSQLLLNFLNVRLIVNGNRIYALEKERPVTIPVFESHSQLVASDGFHFSKPLPVTCYPGRPALIQVECRINDQQLSAWISVLVFAYMVGLISDIALLKVVSFLPILYFLYYFYLRPSEYLLITEP